MAKNTQTKSIFKRFLAGALAVIFVGGITAGICCTGFASRNEAGKWFSNGNLSTWHWSDKTDNGGNTPNTPDNPDNPDNPDPDKPSTGDVTTAGGAIISDIKSAGGISLLSAVLPREAYEANGISPQAEKAFTLYATIEPLQADDRRVEWTVADTSGSINASDYITLNANGLSATISCIQAFDHQLTVTATSLDNPQAKATCTLDYVERLTGVTVNMPKMSSTTAEVTYTVESSKYTIKSNVNVELFNFQVNMAMKDAFLSTVEANYEHYDANFYRFMYPTYADSLVKYTGSSIEFINAQIFNEEQVWSAVEGFTGCFFMIDDQELYSTGDGLYISAFRSVVNTMNVGTVDLLVSSTYGGTTYSSVSKTVEIWVDGASLHIPVTGLSLSDSSIIF